jgi:hypothetical protein
MELYSGAKMVIEKDLKTKYLRSKNREFTGLRSPFSSVEFTTVSNNYHICSNLIRTQFLAIS